MTASEPRRLHPASPVLDLIVSARQWVIPILILSLGSGGSLLFGPAALVGLTLIVGWKVLAWSRFSYWLHDDVLTVEQGVFQRTRREVPVARIQQVDLRRRLRHRALGVAVVRIDTAGGGSNAEVVLEAIADEEADALRTELLGRTAGGARAATAPAGTPPPPPPAGAAAGAPAGPLVWDPHSQQDSTHPGLAPPPPPPPAPTPAVDVVRLTPWQLTVAGITGARLLAAFPLAAAAVGFVFELPSDTTDDVLGVIPTETAAILVLTAVLLPLLALAGVVSSLLTDYGFSLVRIGSDLHLRRGLLDQREVTLSLHRVQVVRVNENLLRRSLGLTAVQLQSAGSGAASEGEVTRLTIPYVPAAELDALLGAVLPVDVTHPPFIQAPAADRRRAWFRRVGPAVLLLGVVAGVWSVNSSIWAWLVLFLVLPLALDAELAFRNLGHASTRTLVVARRGGLVRHTDYVPVAKTQSTRLVSSPFQRRVGLATLHVEVAGSGGVPRVIDGDVALLARLRRGALHAQVARADEDDVRRRIRAEVV